MFDPKDEPESAAPQKPLSEDELAWQKERDLLFPAGQPNRSGRPLQYWNVPRDNYFNSAGDRVSIFPGQSLAEMVHTLRSAEIFPLFCDNNIGMHTIKSLKDNKLGPIHLSRVFAPDMGDEDIYQRISEAGVPMITHDKDFLNHVRFVPEQSPGIIILPHDRQNFYQPLCDQAMSHFLQSIPQSHKEWRQTFRHYNLRGDLVIYEPPFRPSLSGNFHSIPSSRQSYVPAPTG